MRQPALLALLLVACPAAEPEPLAPGWDPVGAVADLASPVRAAAALADGTLLAADRAGLLRSADGSSWQRTVPPGLPEGEVAFLGAASAGSTEVVLAFVHGVGLFRSVDGGASFSPVAEPPALPLRDLLNPRGRPVPFGLDADGSRLWLAAVGGLYRSDDAGQTWTTAPVASSGSLNVLFTGVVARDGEVAAVAQLADSMLPGRFAGLLAGTVFESSDGGGSWFDASEGQPALAPMDLARRADGALCLASMDRGVLCRERSRWTPLGEPFDAVAVEAVGDELLAASASSGLRRWNGEGWDRAADGAVAALAGPTALFTDGRVLRFSTESAAPERAPERAPGTVHLALSFHVNLYHSYRGDTNDEAGYGQDIRVLRSVLDMLDEHPAARADWDIENTFSLDGWLRTEAPDVVERIAARVEEGTDDVRLMSWNNGAMASETREEFDASVLRAVASYEAVFARQVPGVQPQECMVTPEHLAWYPELGIEWITLFHSANGFTGPRSDITLEDPRQRHGSVTLRDADSGASMTWIPVYHHADVLDHGGLAAWAGQLAAQIEGDSLLAIHFDGDAESWENFGAELDALQPLLESGRVVPTTLQTWLDAHPPVGTVDLPGDVADGTGDGFQSWAEKDFNHRLATRIFAAREAALQAEALGGDDPAVQEALAAALTPRLKALSTTHFGLAAPTLAPDRVASAWAFADEALARAEEARALALDPVEAGRVEVHNVRPAAGPALVEFALEVDPADFEGPERVAVHDEAGTELPAIVTASPGVRGKGPVRIAVALVLDLPAFGTRTLSWVGDAEGDRAVGDLDDGAGLPPAALLPPFTECAGERSEGEARLDVAPVLARGLRARLDQSWALPLCGAEGQADIAVERWDGLPGVVVAVNARLGAAEDPEEAESVALTPVACPGPADSLAWRSFGGALRTRPMRPGVDSWNGQSADGWAELGCADGPALSVAHRVPERSSLAFFPVRERDGRAMAAPLGTLWGAGPLHDGRSTGGSGVGEVVTALVGSQYRPAAPDWSGQRVAYRLLLGDDLPPEVLDLFAHPPLVRVGPAAP